MRGPLRCGGEGGEGGVKGKGGREGEGKGEGMWRGAPESGLPLGPRWLSAGLANTDNWACVHAGQSTELLMLVYM